MAGYLIANLDIHDPKAFADYRLQVSPLIARYGGRYLVRGGEVRTLEGDPGFKRLIVLEFRPWPMPSASTTALNIDLFSSFVRPARARRWRWSKAIRAPRSDGGYRLPPRVCPTTGQHFRNPLLFPLFIA
jgi:hypothetical protein